MTLEFIIALIAFTFAASVTPGPNNLMVLASSANFGVRRTLPLCAGVLIGSNFMIWMVGVGIIGVLEAYPASFIVLKAASALFLIYLAWRIATAAAPGSNDEQAGKPLTFFQAAAFQWVNPKAWALALAAVSAYADETRPIVSVSIVALAFISVGVPSIAAWLFLGTQIRRLLTNEVRLRAFNWICAALLLATLWPILSSV